MADEPEKDVCESVVTTDKKNTLKFVGTLTLVPRSIKRVHVSPDKKSYTLEKDLLKEFEDTSGASPLKDVSGKLKSPELRFYVDIAVKENAKYYAHRKLTAIFRDKSGKGLKDKTVKWEVVEPKAIAGFGLRSAFTPTIDSTTNADGLAEVTLVYTLDACPAPPLLAPDDEGDPLGPKPQVKVQAFYTGCGERVDLTLEVWRNHNVPKLDKVHKGDKGDYLLVYQPCNRIKSQTVKTLNHILNQVVSRHKDVPYKFINQDGNYGDDTKTAVDQFVTNFKNVVKAKKVGKKEVALWPYSLSTVGVYESLKDYLKTEYEPFDYSTNEGAVVDRHLLIGENYCKKGKFEPDKIDGLLELKEAVVDPLIEAINKRAQEYFDCNVPWLHKPEDRPHVDEKQAKQTIKLIEAKEDDLPILEKPPDPAKEGDLGKAKMEGGRNLLLMRGDRRVVLDLGGSTLYYGIRLGGAYPPLPGPPSPRPPSPPPRRVGRKVPRCTGDARH